MSAQRRAPIGVPIQRASGMDPASSEALEDGDDGLQRSQGFIARPVAWRRVLQATGAGGGTRAGGGQRTRLALVPAVVAALLLVVGCSGPSRGQEIVESELTRLKDSVLGPADVREFEFEQDHYACDSGDSFYAKRGFLTVDDRGSAAVRDLFVEQYRARGWTVEQYRSGGLDVVRLFARRPDGQLSVDVGILSSGGIDHGSVRFSPCGDEFTRSLIGPDWIEVPVGS